MPKKTDEKSDEQKRFEDLTRQVARVPKKEIDERLKLKKEIKRKKA